jgi:hypothetical protein
VFANQTATAARAKPRSGFKTVDESLPFYSPKQAFLDRTWILPDIEKAK